MPDASASTLAKRSVQFFTRDDHASFLEPEPTHGELVQEISASGGKVIGFATDVTKRAEVEVLIERASDSFGRFDELVNNASIMPIAPIEALKVDEWDRQITQSSGRARWKSMRWSSRPTIQDF